MSCGLSGLFAQISVESDFIGVVIADCVAVDYGVVGVGSYGYVLAVGVVV